MIHVICTDISGLACSDYRALYEKASPERRSKADRYRRWEDSLRCVAADGLLRYALGTPVYTVGKTVSGKPFIRERKDFCYNLSHSGCWVVLAFGDTEVGVDVEQLSADGRAENIARRFFTPEEQEYVFEQEEHIRERFFEIWTGKESYIKYLGTGLQKDLRSFSVLSLKSEVHLHHRMLPNGYSLSVCTEDNEISFELLDVQQLKKL